MSLLTKTPTTGIAEGIGSTATGIIYSPYVAKEMPRTINMPGTINMPLSHYDFISQENGRLNAKVNELERKLAYTELEQPSQHVLDDLIKYRQILPPDFWSFDKIEKLVEMYDKMKDILGENK